MGILVTISQVKKPLSVPILYFQSNILSIIMYQVNILLFANCFRDDSPSDHEVIRSLALADLKKRNAAELDEKRLQEKLAAGETVTEPQPMDHEKAYYPKYKEYEIMPGEGVNNEDRWKDYKNPYAKEHK